ncbi:hypothetical protein SPRG_08069 [Saprolegnia parasitica CBS 223.65]|uniref:WW domain-containing protein n=1 Tax=Saprolegnia parasitica (strain CBS 223.65) TaxID=695850 RepID=A0A067CC86_SAPPC|nr:hypothetical protein SPRG_08069 [Saprolegnia parasitica CBS 223.65]KDO26775.1 hypothetical protein SPRG_08069 [Saprolegnia parasitica CBS 223.65]|eukprot:XP_012202428.1 hypothetical protein SPRG_08069 [Saprolegnia parasitica CBS 223.65]
MSDVIIEEVMDESYEPSDAEVLEHAAFLGMDVATETHLLWIARESLKAPLPKHWKACKSIDTGDIYYFNFATGASIWDHPCDEQYRQLYQEHKTKLMVQPSEVHPPEETRPPEEARPPEETTPPTARVDSEMLVDDLQRALAAATASLQDAQAMLAELVGAEARKWEAELAARDATWQLQVDDLSQRLAAAQVNSRDSSEDKDWEIVE